MVRHSCNNCNTNHTISQVENLRHSCDCSYNNLMTNLKTFCKSGHYSSCCSSSSWSSLFKKPQRSVVSNWIGMKFGRIFPGVIMHRLRESFFKFTFYSQDSDHDIISRKSLRLRLHHYNSDLDEIWQECSLSKYASIDKTRIFVVWKCLKILRQLQLRGQKVIMSLLVNVTSLILLLYWCIYKLKLRPCDTLLLILLFFY